jgi:glycosyltransferase involved in cell wall biosynthesis
MKIALVALHFSEYSLHLAKALAKTHEVLLVCNHENFVAELGVPPSAYELNVAKVVSLSLRHPIRSLIRNSWTISKCINAFDPDVLHVQEAGKDCLIFALPWLLRFPMLLTVHDPSPHSGRDTRLYNWHRYGAYVRILRRSAAAVIVHGNRLKSDMEQRHPRLSGSVFAVPHGPLGDTDDSRNLDFEPGTLLFFGRMERYKGLDRFIALVRRLVAEGVAVKGIIAGRGPDLESKADILTNDPSFEVYRGFIARDSVSNLFRRAHAVVLPYLDATQSGVAAMALGYNRAVVATDVGSIGEIVVHERTGFLANVNDAEELYLYVRRVIDSESVTRSLMSECEHLKTGLLSWDRLASQTTEVYTSVLDAKRQSRQ